MKFILRLIQKKFCQFFICQPKYPISFQKKKDFAKISKVISQMEKKEKKNKTEEEKERKKLIKSLNVSNSVCLSKRKN